MLYSEHESYIRWRPSDELATHAISSANEGTQHVKLQIPLDFVLCNSFNRSFMKTKYRRPDKTSPCHTSSSTEKYRDLHWLTTIALSVLVWKSLINDHALLVTRTLSNLYTRALRHSVKCLSAVKKGCENLAV